MEKYGDDAQRRETNVPWAFAQLMPVATAGSQAVGFLSLREAVFTPSGRTVLGGEGYSSRLVPRCRGHIRIAFQYLHGTVREWSMLFLYEP
ncbi:MAG: hypothetical protein ABIF71_13990 [Planctomycetota bacterium]